MSELKSVNVSLSRKLTDGNYGSTEVHCGVTVEANPGEEIGEIAEEWYARCRKAIRAEYREQRRIAEGE